MQTGKFIIGGRKVFLPIVKENAHTCLVQTWEGEVIKRHKRKHTW